MLCNVVVGRRPWVFEVLAQKTTSNLPKLEMAAEVHQRQRHLFRIDFQQRLRRNPTGIDPDLVSPKSR